MEVKVFKSLPDAAVKIREEVFIKEQGFINEFDDIDKYASHIVLYDNDKPIATARFFIEDDSFIIGRIAVISEYRGKHIGSEVLNQVELSIKGNCGKKIKIHSQYDKKTFYESQGYREFGEIDLDENCPHIWMLKNI